MLFKIVHRHYHFQINLEICEENFQSGIDLKIKIFLEIIHKCPQINLGIVNLQKGLGRFST